MVQSDEDGTLSKVAEEESDRVVYATGLRLVSEGEVGGVGKAGDLARGVASTMFPYMAKASFGTTIQG